jgi:peptidoglycan biosynthesis protein MviN/MurJ (putative lipid II flippase)
MALLEAIVNVSLSVLLCPRFGLIGVAIGAAVPNLVMNLWVIGYTARRLGLPWRRYVADGWLRPLVTATVPAAIWLLADVNATGWVNLATAIGMGLVPYGLVVLVAEKRVIGFWLPALRSGSAVR